MAAYFFLSTNLVLLAGISFWGCSPPEEGHDQRCSTNVVERYERSDSRLYTKP
jgi:hypothetical protein